MHPDALLTLTQPTCPSPFPPSWKDLGKSSSDLLLKDYPTQGTSLCGCPQHGKDSLFSS
ncbi:uncharacterized protein EHS24_003865 [Apiotrichum porosum]|uniref:Uncharacterized protein n=1 Tax=Apiotrichum porosum TaxID=105984 RepID=A0A427XDM4_9TREE|nr:uncharacterized protein EHS24_003865 [Apiotrichum porosum]RSH76928.1 hypothetical protein EHS24_003865 [Apiotrichum porosum]